MPRDSKQRVRIVVDKLFSELALGIFFTLQSLDSRVLISKYEKPGSRKFTSNFCNLHEISHLICVTYNNIRKLFRKLQRFQTLLWASEEVTVEPGHGVKSFCFETSKI